MRRILVFLALLLATSALAHDGDSVSLGDAADHAVQLSKLTLPGSKAFHLKATIFETSNPDSDLRATVEELDISLEMATDDRVTKFFANVGSQWRCRQREEHRRLFPVLAQ